MKAHIEALRGIAYLNAEGIDLAKAAPGRGDARGRGQEQADLLTPIIKGWGTDVGVVLTSLAVQVHGGMGYVEETGVAQHYRDIRIAPIYEGTNGIQAIDLVGRKLGLRGGAAFADFVDRHRGDGRRGCGGGRRRPRRHRRRAGCRRRHPAPGGDVDRCQHAPPTRTTRSPRATPFLALAGIVTEAWVLTRSALAAHALRAGDGDGFSDDFLDQKLVTARFFATQLLPQAAGLLPAITAGPADLVRRPF